MPSKAKVLTADVRHPADADATDAIFTKTSDATATKASHVTSAKATHMASAKASHAPATVSSATTTAAAGLRPRGKKATGKHGACQNHHHSSSHDILHLDGRTFRHRAWSDFGLSEQRKAKVAMHWRWRRLLLLLLNSRPSRSQQVAREPDRRVRRIRTCPMDTKAPPLGGAFLW
jgi:hypothetical protein